MTWNKYNENLIKKWSEMSKTYSIMHSLCADHYSSWKKRLTIPVIILGCVTSSSIFSTSTQTEQWWSYINGGLALLMTVLSGVSNFIEPSEKITKHQNASFKYIKISMDIDTLLSFPRSDRIDNPQEFIIKKKEEILQIREDVPEILPHVLNKYLSNFEKSLTNTKSYVNKNDDDGVYDVDVRFKEQNVEMVTKVPEIIVKATKLMKQDDNIDIEES